jgi:hypothetical protein
MDYKLLFIKNVKRKNISESISDASVRATEATVEKW